MWCISEQIDFLVVWSQENLSTRRWSDVSFDIILVKIANKQLSVSQLVIFKKSHRGVPRFRYVYSEQESIYLFVFGITFSNPITFEYRTADCTKLWTSVNFGEFCCNYKPTKCPWKICLLEVLSFPFLMTPHTTHDIVKTIQFHSRKRNVLYFE